MRMACITQLASSKESAIEDTLGRLSDVNDSLSSVVTGSGDSRAHTLARHRDILHDLSQVAFQETKWTIFRSQSLLKRLQDFLLLLLCLLCPSIDNFDVR